ncbi:MAG TPA: hypothetical protein PK307_01350 [Spirochaetota bacterium]|nr:hypothetical protein [Spirochaetota bacterium]HOD15301.1 hypothetical protein [Spirochaetota bacterium]HPG52523.1 hypothetical protein [Spirochaetota bacterium]HPN13750.1 hypothetical protein [Spirochaetota bacterium]HQL80818.1 hypothetical protein [Spirochaetota bacterium]
MGEHPRCIRHPDRPGVHYCSKYGEYLCDECMACRDPKIYCKFRGSCVINELVKLAARGKRGVTSHDD